MSWSALRLQLALAPTCFGLYSSQEGLWIFYRFCYFWGILNKVLNGEAPPQDPISYPFIYHFLQKRYPFWMTFIEKLYPFHISNLERCFPFNSCKCAIFKIWKKKKSQKQEIIPTIPQPLSSVSPLKFFYKWKWQISPIDFYTSTS